MKKRIQFVLAAVWTAMMATTLGVSALAAQEKDVRTYREGGNWVQETTGSMPSGRMLRIYSALGSVEVRGQDGGNTVTYKVKKVVHRSTEEEAKREWASFTVGTGRRGEWSLISGEWVGARPRRSRMHLEYVISVPKDISTVKLETLGGSVGVYAVRGKVYAQTAGGSISSDDIGEYLGANTLGGNIDVGRVTGEVNLNTAGGSINIGNVGGKIVAVTSGGSVQVLKGGQSVKVETAAGSITVKECGDLWATTAGGTIEVGDVNGWAKMETAGGAIRLNSVKGTVSAITQGGGIKLTRLTSGIQAETANGGIEAEFITAKITESHLATTAGDIIVYLPSDIAVTIKAAIEVANGHKIYSDFSGLKIMSEGGSYGPKQVFGEGSLNGGGPVMKVHTSNGNIYFRRLKR
ncbi:MAG TPA: hypothetical protein VM009_07550 [Terriglobales bacterium]|nr:hypothetical protein [Terriglobales bacterium]